jgi:hypothetical protein
MKAIPNFAEDKDWAVRPAGSNNAADAVYASFIIFA